MKRPIKKLTRHIPADCMWFGVSVDNLTRDELENMAVWLFERFYEHDHPLGDEIRRGRIAFEKRMMPAEPMQ